SVVVDLGDSDRILRDAGERVREVHVPAVEPVEQVAAAADAQLVPAHVRNPPRADPLDPAGEHAEPRAALLALPEEQLHADANAEHGPAGVDAGDQRFGEPPLAQAAR